MIKHGWIVGLLASAATAAFACSSGGSGGNTLTSCAASSAGASSTCTSCVESNCSSEINTYESDCNAFLNCICPGGTYSATAAMSTTCAQKITTSCQSAAQPIDSCEQAHCSSQCTSSSSGGGTGTGGSSSGGGTGNVAYSCYYASASTCNLDEVPSSVLSTVQQQCTAASGTVGTACPTAGVVGCCKSSTSEVCFYEASLAMVEKMQCGTDAGYPGTWTTTP